MLGDAPALGEGRAEHAFAQAAAQFGEARGVRGQFGGAADEAVGGSGDQFGQSDGMERGGARCARWDGGPRG